jgi:hypothetical protein
MRLRAEAAGSAGVFLAGIPRVVLLKPLAIWCALLVVAIANGALREGVLLRALPRSLAFICSGLLLIALVLLVSLLTIRWLGQLDLTGYLLIGILWLALTIGFEFGFGLVRGRSMASLLDAYRFRDGDIWPVVLVFIALAPVIAAYARGLLIARGDR